MQYLNLILEVIVLLTSIKRNFVTYTSDHFCDMKQNICQVFFSILRSTMRNWSQGALRWKKPCGGGVNAQQIGEINGVKLEQNETNLRTN